MWRVGTYMAAVALFAAACSGPSTLDSADAGRTKAYEPGVPNFDMESVVRIDDGVPVVDVIYGIPHSSLVFVQVEGRYSAQYEIVAQLRERETDRLVEQVDETRAVTVSDYDSTLSFRSRLERLTMAAPAGRYIVEVAVTDLETGVSAQRRQSISIAPDGESEPFVGRVLVEGIRAGGGFEPLVSLHMPSMLDSLRATVQLYNLTGERNSDVTMRLLRFVSDTTVASPPYWLAPTRASLAYRGADYDEADTIQVVRRPLEEVGENAVVVFSLPRLSPGIYRLQITGGSGSTAVRRERLLSVKHPSFPSMTSLDDLIEALAYIAFENEIEKIHSAATSPETKRRFDAFWGSLVGNRNLASSLLRLYYGRIEEANLFFSGYKEGWKTDRGMVYTILGPPLYVERRVEMEVWHYSYGDRDPINTFVFERARTLNDDPFETYILQRRPYYQHVWSRAVDRWRDGEVL